LCAKGHATKCKNRLDKEIQLVDPENIILLGYTLLEYVFGIDYYLKNDSHSTKHVLKLDKYYTVFVIDSLKHLAYRRDAIKKQMKKELDFIIRTINENN
jgi:uracil-DNA glycosylase